jgi:hypothetical protein
MEDAHGGAAPAHCIVRNAECAPCIASTAALPINLHALTHTHRHTCTHTHVHVHTSYTHARTLATLPGHTIPSAAWQQEKVRYGAQRRAPHQPTGAVRCPAQSTTPAYCVRSHTVRGVRTQRMPTCEYCIRRHTVPAEYGEHLSQSTRSERIESHDAVSSRPARAQHAAWDTRPPIQYDIPCSTVYGGPCRMR